MIVPTTHQMFVNVDILFVHIIEYLFSILNIDYIIYLYYCYNILSTHLIHQFFVHLDIINVERFMQVISY